MFRPPQPPAPKRGVGRSIFMALLVIFFLLSLLLNVVLIGMTVADGSSSSAVRTVIVDGDSSQTVAVIPLTGTIMEGEAIRFDKFMTQAQKDSDVKAIVIAIDTPGGSVTASDEIYNRIIEFKKARPNVPVVASMGSLATSGGYYAACATDYIIAQRTTLTGNIGVLMPRFNVHKMFDKWGIEETTIASTGATFKNAGSMFKPENPEETAYIQAIADAAFTEFKSVVKAGRGAKLKKPIDQIANGKVYMGEEAKSLGLVDETGYLKDAYEHAGAKLSRMKVVKYEDAPTLLSLLGAKGNLPAIEKGSSDVTINGVNVNLDMTKLQEMMTPRMMYLWRGE
jgi:protease-4